ncbi:MULTISPECIES: EamA family transporter [unclassified Microbacterium]|uniref:DMT family transporter n=1 Tax=unclassified Microbacterium TaxID=2609290 RepID=UPI000A66C32E|nr:MULTISPECIES: EamA family transporter [unclassified Microbacterium]
MRYNGDVLHVIAVLLAAVLFGTTGTSQALGPDGTTPLAVGVMRIVIGGTALALLAFPLASRHAKRHPSATRPRLGIRPALLMALTGLCLAVYQPLFFLGTARNGVAVSTVIALGSAPVLAGLLEWALTRRLPSATWIGATALATTGVVLLGFGGSAGSGGTDPVGVAGAVGAGASFAVIANVQRRLLDAGWDAFTVVGAMGASAAVVGALAMPLVDLSWLAQPRGWAMALWLGLATVAAAYTLFTWGLQGLSAATAATLTLGEPLTASVLGLTVLGEHLSALATVGLAVLAAGLAMLAWGSRRVRDPEPFAVEG